MFEVCCFPKLLLVGCSMDCECFFHPKDAIKYKEEIAFELNGNCKRFVTLRGEGTTTKVVSKLKSIVPGRYKVDNHVFSIRLSWLILPTSYST